MDEFLTMAIILFLRTRKTNSTILTMNEKRKEFRDLCRFFEEKDGKLVAKSDHSVVPTLAEVEAALRDEQYKGFSHLRTRSSLREVLTGKSWSYPSETWGIHSACRRLSSLSSWYFITKSNCIKRVKEIVLKAEKALTICVKWSFDYSGLSGPVLIVTLRRTKKGGFFVQLFRKIARELGVNSLVSLLWKMRLITPTLFVSSGLRNQPGNQNMLRFMDSVFSLAFIIWLWGNVQVNQLAVFF